MPMAGELAIRKHELTEYLTKLHATENLMLIGGFQTHEGEMQLLFQKFTSKINDFKLNIEHKVYYAREKECP